VAGGLAPGSRITGEQRTELAARLGQRYAAGESLRALAQDTGRSFGFVHGLLKESGVDLRSRGGATRGTAARTGTARGAVEAAAAPAVAAGGAGAGSDGGAEDKVRGKAEDKGRGKAKDKGRAKEKSKEKAAGKKGGGKR
jgi:hypothetical protein